MLSHWWYGGRKDLIDVSTEEGRNQGNLYRPHFERISL